jgi:hypothetical protein
MRVTLEVGLRARKVVAVAPDWPGLERSGKTGEAAIERLIEYVPRYARVADLAGMGRDFGSITGEDVEVVEQYAGNGSTDFWGISYRFSSIDKQAMSDRELARELALMQAAWALFDEIRARVSAELRQGPRGGGRTRDRIIRHVVRTEQEDWGRKLGLHVPELLEGMMPTQEGLAAQRAAYCAAIRAYHAEGRMARSWPLRYLIRHTAYHTLDHTWEMEDKDLTVDASRGSASGQEYRRAAAKTDRQTRPNTDQRLR